MKNDLIKKPIPGLIKTIAIPASIGFFFNTMYNVVDTYYAGLISTEAVAALSLSFPIFFTILAAGMGIAQGANVLISNMLGAKKKAEARHYAAQALLGGTLTGIALTFIGLLIAPSLFMLLGATEQYLGTSLAYMNVILYGTTAFLIVMILNSFLQAQGDTKTFRNALIVGFIANLILNPMLMFGWGGLPALGIAGIALATILIELGQIVYMAYKVMQTPLSEKIKAAWFKPAKKYLVNLAKQGVPASLNMMTVALGIFVITYFISKFGQGPVAAYGIATRIEQIALLPTIGLNIACLTLIGQNNGAKKFDRVKETYWACLKYGFYIMILGTIGVFFFAEKLMSIFSKDPEVIRVGAQYLYIEAWALYSYVVLFVSTSALQGIKQPMYGMWMGLARQIILPILVFGLLTPIMGLLGIWWGIFAIVWGSALFSFWYVNRQFRKLA